MRKQAIRFFQEKAAWPKRLRAFGIVIGIAAGSIAISGDLRTAKAACATPNNTALKITLPDYPFWRAVAEEMRQCGNVSVTYEFDASREEVDALNPDKDLGNLVGVSNASLYRLNKQNLLQPLDDLVTKYRILLHPRQLVRVDGRVMAIAVAGNMKALAIHKDLFNQEKIEPPRTYDDVVEAAGRLKGGQLYSFPLSLAYKTGWNLTQEFIDQFLAAPGAQLFDAENLPLISGEKGVATLERMKKLAGLLPEDHLSANDPKVLDDLLKFRAPMAVLWSSSTGPLENPAVSRVSGKMEILPAPAVVTGGKPAATLWWDGFAIPLNASPEEAEAAFITALEGLDAEMLEENRDNAFWLVQDYFPGRLTKNLLAAIDQGVPLYPAGETTALLRRALSPHITKFIKGEIGAAPALGLAEADYLKAARERGLAGL